MGTHYLASLASRAPIDLAAACARAARWGCGAAALRRRLTGAGPLVQLVLRLTEDHTDAGWPLPHPALLLRALADGGSQTARAAAAATPAPLALHVLSEGDDFIEVELLLPATLVPDRAAGASWQTAAWVDTRRGPVYALRTWPPPDGPADAQLVESSQPFATSAHPFAAIIAGLSLSADGSWLGCVNAAGEARLWGRHPGSESSDWGAPLPPLAGAEHTSVHSIAIQNGRLVQGLGGGRVLRLLSLDAGPGEEGADGAGRVLACPGGAIELPTTPGRVFVQHTGALRELDLDSGALRLQDRAEPGWLLWSWAGHGAGGDGPLRQAICWAPEDESQAMRIEWLERDEDDLTLPVWSSHEPWEDGVMLAQTTDRLAMSSWTRLVLWSGTGEKRAEHTLRAPGSGLAFSPDGRFLVRGSRRGAVVHHADDLRVLGVLETPGEVESVAFSADGRWLALGGSGHVGRYRIG